MTSVADGNGALSAQPRAENQSSKLEHKLRILLGSFQEQQAPSLVSHLQGDTKLISNKRYYERLQKQINFPRELQFDSLEVVLSNAI